LNDKLKGEAMAVKRMHKIKRLLPGGKIIIRHACEEDLFVMTALLSELFTIEPDFSPDVRRQREGLAALMGKRDATLLVACVQSEIVGMCTLQPLISTAEGGVVGMVEDLVVAESFRNIGIGCKLLEAIEKISIEQGMSRLQLLADQGNDLAGRFYGRLDWKCTQLSVMRKLISYSV